MLSSSVRSALEAEHENLGLHDPLEAITADRLANVEQPMFVSDLRRLFDEETGGKTERHGTQLPTPEATRQRGNGPQQHVLNKSAVNEATLVNDCGSLSTINS